MHQTTQKRIKHANKEIDGKGRPVGPNGEVTTEDTKVKVYKGYEKGSASKFVDGDLTCDVCGEKFNCNTAAIQHKFRKHPNYKAKFYCPQCGMQFPLKMHRDKHLAAHSPAITRSRVPCTGCGEVFFNKTALDYHYRSTHQRLMHLFQPVLTPPPSKKIKINNAGDRQSVYYCHLCGFEYIVKFNLQKHLERQHSKEERDNVPLDWMRCIQCDAMFYNQKAYVNHNMYHRADDLYIVNEQQRLAIVTRVDQDFDIRRCVLGPEKYLNTPIRRQRKSYMPKIVTKKKEESSDEMSPPSSMDTSSESDSDMPLSKRVNKDQDKEGREIETEKKKVKLKKKVQVVKKVKPKQEDIKTKVKKETLKLEVNNKNIKDEESDKNVKSKVKNESNSRKKKGSGKRSQGKT